MGFLADLGDLKAQGLDRLCAAEATSRGAPASAHWVRSALAGPGGGFSGADQVAAKQAVAAALRRAAATDWVVLQATDDGDAVARRLARAYAVALSLAEEPDALTTNAYRDLQMALGALTRRARRDAGLVERIRAECAGLGPVLAPPRRLTAALSAAAQLLTRVPPVVTRARNLAQVAVADPDPWWQAAEGGAAGAKGDADDGRAAFLVSLLNVYSAQYASYTSLLWQVPALSLTAQAFLLTLALSHGNGYFAKLTASVLSMLIAIASSRLMHDQRGHAINHGELALRISRELRLARQFGDLHVGDAKPSRTNAETIWVGWDRRIYAVWRWTLTLFAAADVVVLIQVAVSAIRHG